MVQKSGETTKRDTTDGGELEDKELAAARQAGKTALEGVSDADIDAVLNEIDEVIEENATTFVAEFVQKGGQ